MKRIKNNEEGYIMLIVLLAVVLFLIMGVSLMTLNMSSVAKNESRESNTQAQDLAVKGLDYVVKEIEYKVEESATSGLSPQQFKEKFEGILDSYKCDAGVSTLQNTETGSATYCIEEYRESDPVNKPLRRDVTFKSTGQAGEKEYVTSTVVEMGSNVSPNEYTLLTYRDNNPSINRNEIKGNIELHGGLQLYGDIYSENMIITSNSSRYKNTVVPSVFPVIKPIDNSENVQLVQGGFLEKDDNLINQIKNTAVGPETSKVKKDLEKINDPNFELEFNQYQFKSKDGEDIVGKVGNETLYANDVNIDFDIVERVNNVRAEFYESPSSERFRSDVHPLQTGYIGSEYILGTRYNNYALLTKLRPRSDLKLDYYEAMVRNLNSTKNKVYVRGYPSIADSIDIANREITNPDKFDWQVYSQNTLNNVAFPGKLMLKYGVEGVNTNPNLKVNRAYVENDMIIGLDNKNEANFDLLDNMLDVDALGALSWLEDLINFDTPVHLEGTYYVNGDLIISSTQLTGNATFFVKGSTTILFADIGVKRFNQNDSKFNILSHGPVKIAYVGNNHNDSEKLKLSKKFVNDVHASEWIGHIHSDTQIAIDGATSNFYVSGSISSQQINITSIKGRTQPSCRDVGYYTRTYVVDGVLDPVLSALLSNKITKELINAVFGKEDDGEDFNMVMDIDTSGSVNKYNANCFEKVEGQNKEILKPPAYLIKVLGIQLIGIGSDEHKIVPRVQINHNPDPINELKRDFQITYGVTPKVFRPDPAKELSRE